MSSPFEGFRFSFTVIADGLQYPEGPVCLPDGTLAIVEVKAGNVVQLQPGPDRWTRKTVIPVAGSPNGMAMGPDGCLWVCNSGGFQFSQLPIETGGHKWTLNIPGTIPSNYMGGHLQKVNLATQSCQLITGPNDNLRGPDDLVFDQHGGLWFTDYGKQTEAYREITAIYYLAPQSSSPKPTLTSRISPNGIALSPDGSRLYVAETNSRWITSWALDPNQPGKILPNPSTLDGAYPIASMPYFSQPDSMAVDELGNLYVAAMVPQGLQTLVPGAIVVISPKGELLANIPIDTPIPDPLPSNICFGGPDRKTAFITLGGTGQVVSCPMPIAGLPHNFAGGGR